MNSRDAQGADLELPDGRGRLPGRLLVPTDARALVLFAHGSGSSRNSPRNRPVTEFLHDVGIATLRFDLRTDSEDSADRFHPRGRNDVSLFARRLRMAVRWVRQQPGLGGLPIGLFGAASGAAAAILAAVAESGGIQAVVTRGGRPDLAGTAIEELRTPTLLIVGGNDEPSTAQSLETWARLRCERALEIIPGAGPLFEEPGALDNVAAVATRWFCEHLCRRGACVA